MNIIVDGKKLDIYAYDNIQTVLERISMDKGLLPNYIKLDPQELKEGQNYKTTDIKEIVKDVGLEDLEEAIPRIRNSFPQVSAKEIIYFWINLHGHPETNNVFKHIDKLGFPNKRSTTDRYNDFLARLKEKQELLKNKIKEHIAINSAIKEIKSHPVEELVVTGRTSSMKVELENKESLIDIFDNISVSRIIPFVVLQYEGKKYYKVYDKFIPPVAWIKESPEKNSYILAKLFRLSDESRPTKIEKSYTDIIWDEENNIFMDVDLDSNIEGKELEDRFFEYVNIPHKITSHNDVGVKGYFNIAIDSFEKYVFLDMITNDDIVSSLLFVNELEKSASEKKKFFVHYYPQRIKNIDASLTFIITPSEGNLRITIQKARSSNQVDQFILMFAKIITIYLQRRESIVKLYNSLLPPQKKEIKEKAAAPKVLKTKERVSVLEQFNPSLFRTGLYGRLAQGKKNQPSVVLDADEANAYRKKNGADSIMEYPLGSGIFYTCSDCKNQYPGLKENTATKVKWNPPKDAKMLEEYEREHPFLPICYPTPQITTRKKGYGVYMASLEGEPKKEKRKSEYVKQISDKPVEPDRSGKLPQNLNVLFSYEEDVSTTIRRIGVVPSPNSFLHCMEKAFNQTYGIIKDNSDREEYIKKVRKSLLDYGDKLNIVKQEMPDYNLKAIKKYIGNTKSFFDPGFFIRLLEYKYDCNIFMYEVNYQKYPRGTVALPNYKITYFMKEIDATKKSVIIIKFPTSNVACPYQCEIIQDLRKKPTFYISDKTLIQRNIDVLYLFNNQTIVKESGQEKFNPQIFTKWLDLNLIESQGIDNNGKVYLLNYNNGLSLFVSPSIPLPIKTDKKYNTIDPDDIQKYIKKNKIVGVSSDKKGLFIKTTSFDQAYIPLSRPIKGEYKIIDSSIYIEDRNQESYLLEMQKNRKIAQYLKEYALFFYSLKGNLDVNDFVIKKNYEYNYQKLKKKLLPDTKIMFKHKKLIVPSENVRDRLLYYIKAEILNNILEVENYKNRKLIKGHYQFISDFKSFPEQLIFIEMDDLIYWLEKETSEVSENEITNVLDSDREIAYFFKDYRINNGKLNIVQNVLDGDLKRALYVAKEWKDNKINIGYLAPNIKTTIKYNVHTLEKSGSKDSDINVLQYDNGNYAALLFL